MTAVAAVADRTTWLLEIFSILVALLLVWSYRRLPLSTLVAREILVRGVCVRGRRPSALPMN